MITRPELESALLKELARRALEEDLGREGDVTSRRVVEREQEGHAQIIAKAAGIVAGIPAAQAVFHEVDPQLATSWTLHDGEPLSPGVAIASVKGRARSILAAERVALNFLQHLSGVATLTSQFVEHCNRYGVRLLCTRKTIPGLRTLQRYAVAAGGGSLHRAGLYDAILIKTNHVKLAGGITKAVERAKSLPGYAVEVEVRTLAELDEAVRAGAQSILLDNADLATIELAVERCRPATLEISGGVSIENVAEIAKARPDAISVGRLTHSAPAVDLALHFLDASANAY